jgi:hypothetical protein
VLRVGDEANGLDGFIFFQSKLEILCCLWGR